MYVSEWKCIMHFVYVFDVSATSVGVFREMHYHRIYYKIVLPYTP
jgi:hypothetical protein